MWVSVTNELAWKKAWIAKARFPDSLWYRNAAICLFVWFFLEGIPEASGIYWITLRMKKKNIRSCANPVTWYQQTVSLIEHARGGDIVVGGCFFLHGGASAVQRREKAAHSQKRQSDWVYQGRKKRANRGMFVLKIVFNMNKENTPATVSNVADVSRFVGTLASETPTRPGGGWWPDRYRIESLDRRICSSVKDDVMALSGCSGTLATPPWAVQRSRVRLPAILYLAAGFPASFFPHVSQVPSHTADL